MNLCEYEIESNSLPAVCTDLKLFPDHDKENSTEWKAQI